MNLLPTCLLFVASFGLTACTTRVDDAESEDQTGSLASAAKVDPDGNGLDTAKVVKAPIFITQSYASALLNNPLRNDSMTSAVKTSVCADPNSHEALQYIVRCAFNAGHNFALTCTDPSKNEVMEGRFGLADTWGSMSTGSCTTATCREWVSACILAISNFAGATGIPVEFAGNHVALGSAKSSAYPRVEGAYWGDIFNEDGAGQKRYGCNGSGGVEATYLYNGFPLKLQSRTCGYFNRSNGCAVCSTGTPSDENNDCGGGSYMPYFMNLDSSNEVRACSSLCGTDAGITSGYFNNCTTNGIGAVSGRVITVWR
jgi:hypothetical protein